MSIDPAATALIRSTPMVLRALFAGVPAAVLLAPNPEGWSLKDIVAHLHDAESIAFVERISRLLKEERPHIQSIDPPARLIAGGYRERQMAELLDELTEKRVEHAAWLESMSAAQLARAGEHDTVGEIRVTDIAHQWAAHDMAHLRQIALMLQGYLAPMMGNTRGFYDV
jgi:hypothetical protein